jgi:hypothetical protein
MKRQMRALLCVVLAVSASLGVIAATRPDPASAKTSLQAAGLYDVRILSLTIPCRFNGGFSLYGVYFDASVESAQAVNQACYIMRDASWVIAGPFRGF